MEKYSVVNNSYIADDGFLFKNKTTGGLAKGIYIDRFTNINNYEVIPEEQTEEMQNDEVTENG